MQLINAETKIAKVVSILFHPIFVGLYGVLILFSLNSYLAHQLPVNAKLLFALLIFVLTCCLPMLFLLMLRSSGYISSYIIEDKKQRTVPYFVTLIFYLSTYFMLTKNDFPTVLSAFVFSASLVLLATLLINFIWKISAHMMAMGALVASVYAMGLRFDVNILFFLALSVLIAGVVGFARLALKAHTPTQVYIGFVLGFLIQLLCFFRMV